MRVVITMDGFEVYRGTVAECAEFLRAWAIVSTTTVRTVRAVEMDERVGERS